MRIQILGMGCAKCKQLAENAEAAAKELGVEFEIVKVTELADILDYQVLRTPALAVDGKVKLVGRVAAPAEILELLKQERGDEDHQESMRL